MATDTKSYFVDEASQEEGVEMRPITRLGGTDVDEHEMRVLGRTQQLNVSNLTLIVPQVMLDPEISN